MENNMIGKEISFILEGATTLGTIIDKTSKGYLVKYNESDVTEIESGNVTKILTESKIPVSGEIFLLG